MGNPIALRLLKRNLPASCIVTDPLAVKPFETDGLTAYREKPWVVVLPESVDQVRTVLRICREHEVPVVTRGAGTGLSGGALPLSEGLLLTLTKMWTLTNLLMQNVLNG